MQDFAGSNSFIKEIEKNIEQYDRILIFDSNNKNLEELLNQFLKSKVLHNADKKVIIYGYSENIQNEQYRVIARSEYEDIISLYYLYEFSDKIMVISDSAQYASMRNYLSNNIISQEEYFEALLH